MVPICLIGPVFRQKPLITMGPTFALKQAEIALRSAGWPMKWGGGGAEPCDHIPLPTRQNGADGKSCCCSAGASNFSPGQVKARASAATKPVPTG